MAHNWFVDEVNKILGVDILRKQYDKEEIEDTLQEVFNSPIQYIRLGRLTVISIVYILAPIGGS